MANILVVYGSRHGCAQRIGARLAEQAQRFAHQVQLVAAKAAPPPAGFDMVLVVASIQMGRHPRAVESWVTRYAEELSSRSTALLSVSLSAMDFDGSGSRVEARRSVERFQQLTGFRPGRIELVAGDLPYRKYNFLTRWMMKRIVAGHGGPTDTSRDYEFTDWTALEKLGEEIFAEPRVAGDGRAAGAGRGPRAGEDLRPSL